MLMDKIGNFEWGLYDKGIYVILGKIWNLDNLKVLEKKCTKGYFGKFAP